MPLLYSYNIYHYPSFSFPYICENVVIHIHARLCNNSINNFNQSTSSYRLVVSSNGFHYNSFHEDNIHHRHHLFHVFVLYNGTIYVRMYDMIYVRHVHVQTRQGSTMYNRYMVYLLAYYYFY